MEPERFDELAASVAEGETSRRSVVLRLGGGGLAALLAAIGLDDGTDDADARRRGRGGKGKGRRPRRRRRRRKGGGNDTPNSPPGSFFEINNNIDLDLLGNACTLLGDECGDGTGLGCVGLICLPIGGDDGLACTDGGDCDSGRCTLGLCVPCPLISVCEENTVCCVVEADCVADVCVLPEN